MPTTLSRSLAVVAALAIALTTLLVPSPAEAATRARTAPEQLAESIVLRLHNEARANPGAFGYGGTPTAPALQAWTDIRDVARSWADRQAADARMYHNPNFSGQLCCWTRVGENVAYITLRGLDDAQVEQASRAIFQAWMDSTGHRDNIMDPQYDQMGLGVSIVARSSGYAMYLTGNFRRTTGTPPGSAYGATSPDSSSESAPEPEPYSSPACPEGAFDRGIFLDSVVGTHAGAIDCLVWHDVIAAGRDTYGQNELAGRGFMASVIDRLATAAGEPLPTPSRDHFRDDDGHAHEDAINRVAEAGIAGGFPDGTFRPDSSLTRGQLATFLATVYSDWFELPQPKVTDRFDDDASSLHEDNINLVASADIAHGTGTRTFSPGRRLTRGQLASFAIRTADHLAEADRL